MRESIPNRRHGPVFRHYSGPVWLPLLSLLLLALISCGGSLLLDQSHVDEVKALIDDGRYAEAEARAADLLDDSHPGEGASALARAEVMGLHASALRRSNPEKRTEARDLAQQALELKIELVGESHPSVADSWYDLGFFHDVMGEPDEARQAWERSLNIRRSVLGPDHPAVALSLIKLSQADYIATRDAESALALLDEARLIQEKSLPDDHPHVAIRYMTVGYIKHYVGDYTAAGQCYQTGLEIRQRCLRPDHPFTRDCHTNLGHILNNLCDFTKARRHKEKAMEINQTQLGPDHLFIASDLTGLANLLHDMGDLDEAEQLFRRALEIQVNNLGDSDQESLQTALSLAMLLRDTGAYQEASELYAHVLAHTEEEDDAAIGDRVMLLNRYGSVLHLLGREREAEESIGRGLTLALEKLGKDHRRTRSVMLNQASLLFIQGETEEADRLFRQGLENYDAIPGGHLSKKIYGLTEHAQVLAALHRREEALESALLAESLAREHLQLTARFLETGLALKFAASCVDGLHAAVSIMARDAEDDPALSREETADAIVRSRALVLDELATRAQTVRESADPQIAARHRELQASRNTLAELATGGTITDSAELTQATARKERAERDLAEASQSWRRQQQQGRVGMEAVRAALPPGCALVAFLRYFDASLSATEEDDGESDRYLALILAGSDAPARILSLGEAQEIDGLMLGWRDELLKGTAADVPGLDLESSYRKAGGELRKRIWDPLLPHLGAVEKVFLVPDSALHLVSFAALPVGDGNYLIEDGPTIHYLSAEREVARFAGSDPVETTAGSGLLLIGDPAFGAGKVDRLEGDSGNQNHSDQLLLRYASLEFTPLPGTAEEVRRVAELWRSLSPGADPTGAPLVTLTGEQATEPAFRRAAAGCRTLHLATHAYFLQPESAGRSDGQDLQRIQTGRRAFHVSGPDDNPLLRAGLALAGANLRDDGDEDGILTAEEIVSLDLGGVQLAVLSACDTGLGTVQSGEGVFGLRRAFRLAGVNTVVNSLWPVEDVSASQWMETFYRSHFSEGDDVTVAAHRASLSILNNRRGNGLSGHPFFWAAFVASGDWR